MIKVNGRVLEYYIRTGGEVHLDLSSIPERINEVKAKLESSNDIMALLLLDSARLIYNLHIYYFPYARADRYFEDDRLLPVELMARLINCTNAQHVYLVDPHSPVTTALVNKSLWIADYIDLAKDLIDKADVLVAPDQGAYKKLLDLELDKDIAFAVKSRDKTGKPRIEGIFGADVKGKKCLVLDDICDGGRTFVDLAEKLYVMSPYNMSLFTTYGIYSNQDTFDELFKYYNWVSCYCTINYKGNDPRLDVIGDMN